MCNPLYYMEHCRLRVYYISVYWFVFVLYIALRILIKLSAVYNYYELAFLGNKYLHHA